MVMSNNRGQFFLLAAVIISAVVISFGTVTNSVVIFPEKSDLSDYSFDVKREAGNVIDYEIYKNFTPNVHLPSFINLLASEVRGKDPNITFMFVYGNNDSLTVRNYGTEGSNRVCSGGSCNYTHSGFRKISSTIRYGSTKTKVSGNYNNRGDNWEKTFSVPAGANITVEVQGKEFPFRIGRDRQVIFILQKEDNDESFVYVR